MKSLGQKSLWQWTLRVVFAAAVAAAFVGSIQIQNIFAADDSQSLTAASSKTRLASVEASGATAGKTASADDQPAGAKTAFPEKRATGQSAIHHIEGFARLRQSLRLVDAPQRRLRQDALPAGKSARAPAINYRLSTRTKCPT